MNYSTLQRAIIQHGAEMPCESAPDLFFPHDNDNQQNRYLHERLAKKLCYDCPLQLACLEYALDNNETDGIWGGTTHHERRNLTRRQRRMVK